MKRVIKLSAGWCGPCKQYAPVFDRVTENLEGWEVLSLDIDTDEGEKLAKDLGVRGVPATVVVVEGEETQILMGYKSDSELEKVLS